MPIKIPDKLPARKILERENIFVMTERRAIAQDIRPLKLLILNLMPTKIETETQLLRLISNTPLQIEPEFLQMASHVSKNTAKEHLTSFYQVYDDIKHNLYDGLIITGAPVELMDFEQVDYWPELCEIFKWSRKNVFSTLHICWGAQAGLYYHYGISKHILPRKMFGVFEHKVLRPKHELLRGFDERFYAPHSRHTSVDEILVKSHPALSVLASSKDAGLYIAASKDGRDFFVTGHSEYDADTLAKEYYRDKGKGLDIHVPINLFPNDDPTQKPRVRWRSHANLLFCNWLNYFVYQTTPYDLTKLSD